MNKNIFLLITFLILTTGCIAVQEIPENKNKIEVTGKAEFETAPDQGIIWFEIQTNSTNVMNAQRDNEERSRALIDAMLAKDVIKKDIETTQYNIMKNTKWDDEKNEIVELGYKVVHVVKITSKQTEKLGELVDSGVIAGVTGIQNIVFELSKEKEGEMRAKALELAVKNAKEKAEALASGLGQKVGKALTVSEMHYMITPFYAMRETALMEKGPEPSIMPQQVNVNVQVNVAFELR